VIHGSEHGAVAAGTSLMLKLLPSHCHVRRTSSGELCGCRVRVNTVRSATIAHATDGVLGDNRGIVNVTNDRGVYVGHAGVIEIFAAAPVSAVIACAGITETVVDAAVEADGSSPVTSMPNVQAVVEGPVTGSPQKSDSWRSNPDSWNPKVTVITISPVTRHPNVTTSRTKRLGVNRQQRWTNTNRNCEVHPSGGGRSGDVRCR
jgi:hypothetical protein